jgi:hypothetical protein
MDSSLSLSNRKRWCPRASFESARGQCDQHSPRAFPRELQLPWAPSTLLTNTVICPERGDLARESACAMYADASTNHIAGTSGTSKTRNACGKSAAGKRVAIRLNVARMPASRPSMPRPRRAPAASQTHAQGPREPRSCARAWSRSRKAFPLPFCDRPGCHEPPVRSLRSGPHAAFLLPAATALCNLYSMVMNWPGEWTQHAVAHKW